MILIKLKRVNIQPMERNLKTIIKFQIEKLL